MAKKILTRLIVIFSHVQVHPQRNHAMWRHTSEEGRWNERETSRREGGGGGGGIEGGVGVAVYELGRTPPRTKHIFMAQSSPQRQPALSSSHPTPPKEAQTGGKNFRPRGTASPSSTKDSSAAERAASPAAVGTFTALRCH